MKFTTFVKGLLPSLFRRVVHTATFAVIVPQVTTRAWCLDARDIRVTLDEESVTMRR